MLVSATKERERASLTVNRFHRLLKLIFGHSVIAFFKLGIVRVRSAASAFNVKA